MSATGLFTFEWPPAFMIFFWPLVEILRTRFYEVPHKVCQADSAYWSDGAPVALSGAPNLSEPMLSGHRDALQDAQDQLRRQADEIQVLRRNLQIEEEIRQQTKQFTHLHRELIRSPSRGTNNNNQN